MVKLASAYLTAGRVQQLKEVALRGGATALHKQELHGGYHGTCLCVCAGVCVFECKCVLYMFEYVGRVFPATNRETVAL
jgi:hypothetical protein